MNIHKQPFPKEAAVLLLQIMNRVLYKGEAHDGRYPLREYSRIVESEFE